MNDKEIRFIDSNYRELFRIPDGGKINITLNDGEQLTRQCKYIDDYHFQLSEVDSNYGNVYHICQFAELMDRNGNTYEPVQEDSRYRDIKFVEQTYGTITEDKFFKTDSGITEVYYNPDANSGGQLVYIEASDDIIREAAEKFKKPADFFSHIEGMGRGYLIDVGTPEFRGNLESFMNRKADFEDLYNHMIEELMEYARVMKGKSSADEANRLINVIEKYVYLGTDRDGTEYAVMRLFPSDASSLIGILAMVATSAIGEPKDYYAQLKKKNSKR